MLIRWIPALVEKKTAMMVIWFDALDTLISINLLDE